MVAELPELRNFRIAKTITRDAWGEPERAIEVRCRFFSTVEDGALSLSLRRTRPFAGQDSVIRVRIEV